MDSALSEFRRLLSQAFGRDFSASVPCLPGPRLRFELACGESKEERLREAERRCLAIFGSVFGSAEYVFVEVALILDDVFGRRAPEDAIEFLGKQGLHPIPSWSLEKANGEEQRYSGRIRPGSQGLASLLRGVMWREHGTWEGLSPYVIFLDPLRRLVFYPYDDRGADLVATEVATLREFYAEFDNWILDCDRSRIQAEMDGIAE